MKLLYIGIKTRVPDIIIETIVGPVISDEYTKIKITKNTHSKAINPICIGVSFFRAIKFCSFNFGRKVTTKK